jgi:hypothetical protein
MGISRFITGQILDLQFTLKNYKKHLIISFVLLVLGMVAGFIITGTTGPLYYESIANYLMIVVHEGGFFQVLWGFLYRSVMMAAFLYVLSFRSWLNPLKYILVFVLGVYSGMYMLALVNLYTIIGIVFYILVFLVGTLVNIVAIVFSFADCESLNCFVKVDLLYQLKCNLRSIFTILLGLTYKMIIIFIILRLFTSLI